MATKTRQTVTEDTPLEDLDALMDNQEAIVSHMVDNFEDIYTQRPEDIESEIQYSKEVLLARFKKELKVLLAQFPHAIAEDPDVILPSPFPFSTQHSKLLRVLASLEHLQSTCMYRGEDSAPF